MISWIQSLQENRKSRRFASLLIGVFGALLYVGTIGHDFALDDALAFTDNEYVTQGVSGIDDIFNNAYLHGFDGTTDESYRPLPLAINALQVELFGVQPTSGHVLNIILYGVLCGLLFALLFLISKQAVPAFIIAVLFATHPIHSEVVANIKGGDELLSFVFIALSLYLYFQKHVLGYLLSALCLFAAIISKETVLVFVVLIPITVYFSEGYSFKAVLKTFWIWLVPVVLYFVIRANVLESVAFVEENLKVVVWNNGTLASDNSIDQLGTAMSILLHYLQWLVIPVQFSSDYSYAHFPIVSLFSGLGIAASLTYIAILAAGVYGLVKKQFWALGVWWFLLPLALTSNIFVKIAATAAERFLFIPSFGLLILVVFAIWKFRDRLPVKTLGFICIAYVIYFSSRTVLRAQEWENNATLFYSDIKKVPNSAKLNYNYGVELLEQSKKTPENNQRQLMEALQHMKKTASILPSYHMSYLQLAEIHTTLKQYDEAISHYVKYLSIKPEDVGTWNNLARVYIDSKQLNKAQKVLKKCYALDPNFGPAMFNRGSVAYNLENYNKAIEHFSHFLKTAPADSGKTNFYIGMSYFFLNDYTNAQKPFNAVPASSEYYAEAQTGLGMIEHASGRLQEAIAFYKKALEIEPQNQAALPNLYSAYKKLGMVEEANRIGQMLGL